MAKAAVRERPILMSGPMVKRLLAGAKTQTRRVMKPQPEPIPSDPGKHWWSSASWRMMVKIEDELQADPTMPGCFCPYGKPGDRLWVRETWQKSGIGWSNDLPVCKVHYKATDGGEWKPYWGNWKPSIHMPRWASRITLEIAEVRVERPQEISHDDAAAEGVEAYDGRPCPGCSVDFGCLRSKLGGRCETFMYGYREAFQRLWDEINGKRPGSTWKDNPWCWALTFRRVTEDDPCPPS